MSANELTIVTGNFLRDARHRAIDYLIGPNYFDRRVEDWPLTSATAALCVVGMYLGSVQAARALMVKKPPVDVSALMTWHNALMAMLSLWMTVETLRSEYLCAGWDQKLRIWGTTVAQGETFSPPCRRLAVVLYVHYLSKIPEFADTFFMVLKRNDHQISFLHVYHHASTFLCWWTAVNFSPGGDAYFICAVNSFVHVIMYSYYFLSTTKMVRIPVAVKKSITALQMVQFAFLMAQALYGTFVATYYRPKIVVVLALSQGAIFMALFGNFFLKSYGGKTRKTRIMAEEALRETSKAATA